MTSELTNKKKTLREAVKYLNLYFLHWGRTTEQTTLLSE